MLSQESLERLSERLIRRIEELNTFMIEKLGKQLYDIGTFTPSQIREIYQSIQYGNDIDKIINKIAEITDKNIEDIYEIFKEVAIKNQKHAKKFYDYKKIKFIPYEENKILQEQVKALAKVTANEYMNISRNAAFQILNDSGELELTPLSKVYQKITDAGILNVSQGRESYTMQIRRIMREMSSRGMQSVDYASGYHRRIDSSVRMNLLDGVRQLSMNLQEQFGEEFGADGVEISHHKNPAPDHSEEKKEGWHDIDGHQFSKEEYNRINESLKRKVGTLNCYHFAMPIMLGVSKPLYNKDKLKEDKEANREGFEFEGKHYTNYEGTQLQRRIETRIRQYKDRQIGSKAINDLEDVDYCQNKIFQLTKKYKELSEISGLPTKVDRLSVEKYKKIKIKNDTHQYKDVTNEWLDKAAPNSHKIKFDNYFIDDNHKRHPIKNKEIAHPIIKSGDEYEIANFIKENLGGDIHLVPRITDISNESRKVSTPDFRWKGKKWDLKTPGTDGLFENTLERFLKKKNAKKQAKKFIINYKNFPNKSSEEIIEVVMKTLNQPSRQWVEDIILIQNNKIIKIVSKK